MRSQTGMSPFARYLLFQLPGTACVALLLIALWHWAELAGWIAAGAFILWVLKDLALYPFLRRAHEPVPAVTAALVGRCGIVRRPLAPHGIVALGTARWRAEPAAAGDAIAAGEPVRVVAVRGLTLLVVRDEDAVR